MYKTIEVEYSQQVATVWLNRPEVRNAFNDLMVHELHQAFDELANIEQLRVVVLRGRGNSFCSGADLNWMREVIEYDYEKNVEESLMLAKCLSAIYYFPRPVIALAQGAVIGGGLGILSATDISITSHKTLFSLSEVTIGLVPAVISPYIIRRVGSAKARELMLLGEKFSGDEAVTYGLINIVTDDHDLETRLKSVVSGILQNSPLSLLKTKELLNHIGSINDEESVMRYTAKVIAHARVSEDGQEGMAAFLEKRKPVWK
jgi:methylglutaconyl-CoA hydratase